MGKRKLKYLNFMLVVLLIGSALLQGIGTKSVDAEAVFAGGDGTEESPYQVTTAEQLNEVRYHLDKHFEQTADIDLSGYVNWEPIGDILDATTSFSGTYNGQLFKITNLTINNNTKDYVGLFGYVKSGELLNIGLESVTVTGRFYVGGLVGYSTNSIVSRSFVSGNVTGIREIGGLVGYAAGTTISESFAVGTATATAKVMSGAEVAGGLVGSHKLTYGNEGLIINSYAISVVNSYNYTGGLVGSTDTRIENSFAAGQVGIVTNTLPGGLIGTSSGNKYKNNYYDRDTTGRTDSRGAEGKTTIDMKKKATFTDWDFETIWTIEEGVTYPYFKYQEEGYEPPEIEAPEFPNCPAVNEPEATISNNPPPSNNWKKVSVGENHTLAIHDNDTLWAWGNNSGGQLGIGNKENQLLPVQVGTSKWKHISAGKSFSVGIKQDGSMWSWGSDDHTTVSLSGDGRLGIGECLKGTIFPSPQKIGNNDDWLNLSVASSHIYAQNSNFEWYTWGNNQSKQIGVEGAPQFNFTPTLLPKMEYKNVANETILINPTMIAPVSRYTLAISEKIKFAWGQNAWDQFGIGLKYSSPLVEKPMLVGGGPWIDVASGSDHSFAIDQDGVLWASGYNVNGELGVGYFSDPFGSPLGQNKVKADDHNWKTVKALASGGLALKNDGTIWGWGDNAKGQTGLGHMQSTNSPEQIGTDDDWKQISANNSPHAAGIKEDGSLWVWGYNHYGQLGLGHTDDIDEPTSLLVEGLWFEEQAYAIEKGEIIDAVLKKFDEDKNVITVTGMVTYTIENEEVATINSEGKIAGTKPGSTVVKAMHDGKEATATIYVFDKIMNIKVGASNSLKYDGISVDFPEEAMTHPFNIYLNDITESKNDLPIEKEQKFVGKIIEFTKDEEGNFNPAIEMTFPFNKTGLTQDVDQVSLYWLNEQTRKWIELKNITVNWAAGTVTGYVDHFTKFAVIASPLIEKIAWPEDAKIEITNLTHNSFKVLFPKALGDVSHYSLLISSADQNMSFLDIEDIDLPNVIGLQPSTIYNVEVTAFNADERERKSLKTTVTTKAKPSSGGGGGPNPRPVNPKPVDPPVDPTPEKPEPVITFSDIKGNWAEEYIQQAVSLGIIKGFPDGSFKPNQQLTRVQAISIIVRALNLESDESTPFDDIGKFAEETQAEIAAAYHDGLVIGQNGKFMPSKKVTRAQIALMLHRAYEYKTGVKYIANEKAPYPDFGNYDVETVNAISMLYELGIASGSDGKYKPNHPTTRAHAAKMIVNFFNAME